MMATKMAAGSFIAPCGGIGLVSPIEIVLTLTIDLTTNGVHRPTKTACYLSNRFISGHTSADSIVLR